MVEASRRTLSISEPVFAPNPTQKMPGHHLPEDDEAARISHMIDEDLKVCWCILVQRSSAHNKILSSDRKST